MCVGRTMVMDLSDR
ncbi:hypothetical protein E2C01_053735 [Portunus trituberculatus]|uniref:Uncharacterized protein n=1 Tax=Portunus trituberculatus TaxID=210409 RepID=A0A5B7GRL9_PORTR|nr:hypothetical protein [Portunus trituberculatus]